MTVSAEAGSHDRQSPWSVRDRLAVRRRRLNRSVAIKILPAEFAQNAELKICFEQEAKPIAQLNHPHESGPPSHDHISAQ